MEELFPSRVDLVADLLVALADLSKQVAVLAGFERLGAASGGSSDRKRGLQDVAAHLVQNKAKTESDHGLTSDPSWSRDSRSPISRNGSSLFASHRMLVTPRG